MRLISAVSGVQFPAPPYINYVGQSPATLKGDKLTMQISSTPGKSNNNIGIHRRMQALISCFFITTFILFLTIPSLTYGAEKKTKIQPKPRTIATVKDIVINDGNLQTYQKRVEELVKKGDFENSLNILLKIHDYANEVLTTVKTIKTHYEKAVSDPSIAINDKENLLIKLKGLNQLIPRYTTIYETTTFNLGYIYAKRGDTEKARKYLVEFLQVTPFSSARDSRWMKAKTLLLELYSLEGEF
jgi:tetratricopeptide (TPR) repeat protein